MRHYVAARQPTPEQLHQRVLQQRQCKPCVKPLVHQPITQQLIRPFMHPRRMKETRHVSTIFLLAVVWPATGVSRPAREAGVLGRLSEGR